MYKLSYVAQTAINVLKLFSTSTLYYDFLIRSSAYLSSLLLLIICCVQKCGCNWNTNEQ